MLSALVALFVITYALIALEHPVRINKSASALVGAGLLWTVYALASGDHATVEQELNESLAATAQIVFFLIGAMTIVEVIDSHDGFSVITSRIRTTRLDTLMWQIGLVTFFLSSVLDNLTTTIVMISLTRKLLDRRDDRLLFASMIVIAANAGGAWTPIGDVTTTMLWIGGQITTLAIMKGLFIASMLNLIVPLMVVSQWLKGRLIDAPNALAASAGASPIPPFERNVMFFLGFGIFISVPAFKTVTHLPPFMGILLGLGILWLVGELLHRTKDDDAREHVSLTRALKRIDMSSVVFFVGILLAVATLEHTHILAALAQWLDRTIGRVDLIVIAIGLVSAVVDNIPLIAASMGMYPLAQNPPDSFLWEFVAYCAGTGGSILIIGSAAGVAAMGLEKIHFFWYARRISGLALLGYFAGIAAYIVQYRLTHG